MNMNIEIRNDWDYTDPLSIRLVMKDVDDGDFDEGVLRTGEPSECWVIIDDNNLFGFDTE